MKDASDFPSSGQSFNTEALLPDIDYLLDNTDHISRQIGVRPPDPLVNNPVKSFSSGATNRRMPTQNIVPDVPKSVAQQPVVSLPNTESVLTTNPYSIDTAPRKLEISYFKDPTGNQYKTVGDTLYVLGWQDTTIKIRVVNDKTGKVIPTDGKKFQVYGWHLVNKITSNNEIKDIKSINNVDELEKSLNVEIIDKKDDKTVECVSDDSSEPIKDVIPDKPVVKTPPKGKKRII